MCEFLEQKYKEYFILGTRELTAEELQDQPRYLHKNKRDLIYKGFNTKIFKAFLSTKAVNTNGKTDFFLT